MPRALITGITGQDGSYLAELLLDQGYEVHGTIRPGRPPQQTRLRHRLAPPQTSPPRLLFHPADLQDPASLRAALLEAQPDEIYHLASPTHVGASYQDPERTCADAALGTLRLLELVRHHLPSARFFHASSSEIFGHPLSSPQDESTPFTPLSPYGCAKTFATHLVATYRRAYRLFACNGILFNHESPRRGESFVTRKITRAAAAIQLGRQTHLTLGDTSAQRDWGDARDFVRGMWLALQHPTPEDFVFATGALHSVQDVVEIAFATVGLDWRHFVRQDPALFRPAEPARLVGQSAKAQRLLGWTARTAFRDLIAEMTRADLAELEQRPSGS